MRSLRRRLLVSLWVVVIVVGATSALLAYREAKIEAKGLLDNQLEQIAGFVAAQAIRVPGNRDADEQIEVAVWDSAGRQTFSTTPLLQLPMSSRPGFTEILLRGEPYRLYTAVMNGRHVEVAQPMDTRDDVAEGAAIAALIPVTMLLPVLAIVIALVIRALLRPVREAAATVSRRNALDVGALQTDRLPAEIVPLVEEINRLLERQREAVDREHQFVADAAHALRTPLAALQLQTDVLQDARTDEQRQARFAELRDGIHRTSRLAVQLLSIARSSSLGSDVGNTDVDGACQSAVERMAPLCRAKNVEVIVLGTQGLHCVGSPDQIGVVLNNLLDNAIRYTEPFSRVLLSARESSGNVVLEIEDQGPGLPDAELERVFSRFYRAPGDRTEGSGLGLSIVASIVQTRGGSVTLSNRIGGGLSARVCLPGA